MTLPWISVKNIKRLIIFHFTLVCVIYVIIIIIYGKKDIHHDTNLLLSSSVNNLAVNDMHLEHKPLVINDVKQDIHKIIRHRNQMPLKCPQSSKTKLVPIEPISHNWAAYYHRCNYLVNRSMDKVQWCAEAFLTPDIFYNHVFKAAGTTIQGGLVHLAVEQKLNNLNKLHSEYVVPGGQIAKNQSFSTQNVLKYLNDDALIFTFLRDPIDKFLSGFYEAHYRVFKEELDQNVLPEAERANEHLSGVEILRIWIDFVLKQDPQHRNYINAHARPNSFFLQAANYSMTLPFNYIGHLSNFETDLPQLLMRYINDMELKQNETLLMERYFSRRNKKLQHEHESLRKYQVKKPELSAIDIRNMCELYWLDYLCFPFSLPHECDLEELIVKHYGVDIEYYQCYM